MNREYSWDDQDPEQMQQSLEFNDPFGKLTENDGANFPIIESVENEIDGEDEEDPEFDYELEEILRDSFSHLLSDVEIEIIFAIRGIGRPSLTIQDIADVSGVALEVVTRHYEVAISKLRASDQFRNWI